MTKKELAKKYFEEGYNCAQSVVLAFADDVNVDKETLKMLSSSFGGGMGKLREVCGAVTGMFIIAGIKKGYTSPNDDITKQDYYTFVQNLALEFKDEFGSYICRELLGLVDIKVDTPVPSKRTKEYYESRPCGEYVGHAAEILDTILKKTEEVSVKGNLLKIQSEKDFSNALLSDLEVKNINGKAVLSIKEGKKKGIFVSPIFSVEEFETMVASWNAAFDGKSSVEIMAKAFVEGELDGVKQNGWTGYLSWGEFGPEILRSTKSGKEKSHGEKEWAYMDDDTFTIKGSTSGATKIQLRAVLKRENPEDPSPLLTRITATFANSNKGKEIKPTYGETPFKGELPKEAYVKAPACSQAIREKEIENSICSPTTIAMMMNSRGLDLIQEEVALNIYDFKNEIFGNWAYTTAGAGMYGFEAYAQFADENILMQELAKGHSLGLSVRYDNKEEEKYYLKGCYGHSAGHLITIIGYDYDEGHQGDKNYLYFYSGDSYCPEDNTAYRRYKWEQLNNCWVSRIAYIMPSTEREIPACGVKRIECQFKSYEDGSFALFNGNEMIDLTDFTTDKLKEPNRGVICYNIDGIKTDMVKDQKAESYSVIYKNPMNSIANNKFFYENYTLENGRIRINKKKIMKDAGLEENEDRKITFYFITNQGKMYISQL